MVLVQNRAGSPLQGNLRLVVRASGSDLRRAGLCEVILILDHHEVCGESNCERLLFNTNGLLLKPARLYRRLIGGAPLPQRLLSVGDLQANLILQLLAAYSSLP